LAVAGTGVALVVTAERLAGVTAGAPLAVVEPVGWLSVLPAFSGLAAQPATRSKRPMAAAALKL
jgi:hypothetical protein